MRERIPLYPVILASALLLSLTVPSGASPYAGLRLLVGFAVGAALLAVFAGLLLGDRHRAGVASTLVILYVFKGLDWRIGILLLAGLAAVVVERLVSRRRPLPTPWPLAGRVANAAAVVLLLAVGLQTAGDGSLGAWVGALRSEGPAAIRDQVERPEPIAGTPDVFLILLDGHARADKLASIFGHDGAPFVAALEQRGFEVAPASRSNYLLTAQSLTSMLNMAHMADLVDAEAASAGTAGYTLEVRRLTASPAAFGAFRGLGYEVVAIASGFEEVALRGADRFIDTGQANELEVRTLGNTVLAPAIQLVAPDWFADQQRSRVVAVFDAAVAVAAEPHDRPRFVIAHVPSPHAPIVYAADGSAVPMGDLANFYDDTFTHRLEPREAALAAYAGQVAHVDDLALAAVDAIGAAASSPPVILVMSDHGSGAGLDWDNLGASDLDERTANLFAALTPGHPGVFSRDVSLVNVVGRLLEEYFGRRHDPAPDTAYRWEGALTDLVPIALPGGSSP